MGNSIKYSEGSESLALNKGNWWIGTVDTNKGPTAESGYWNAINPPSGGYTVYLNKESNGPSIHSISNDEQLISFTNKISGNNYVNVAECLVYYQMQDDKLCVNREIENIVTDGLVLNLDAGYVPSYPTSGVTWYDLSGNGNNGSLVNGTIFSGGSMVFDGADDTVEINNFPQIFSNSVSMCGWFYFNENNTRDVLFGNYDGFGDINFEKHTNNNLRLWWNSGVNNIYSSNNVISAGVWQFMIIQRNKENQTFDFYVNSSLVSQPSVISADVTNSRPLYRIGRDIRTGTTALNGKVAHLSIYNRALSSQEVLQNYNAQKSRFGL